MSFFRKIFGSKGDKSKQTDVETNHQEENQDKKIPFDFDDYLNSKLVRLESAFRYQPYDFRRATEDNRITLGEVLHELDLLKKDEICSLVVITRHVFLKASSDERIDDIDKIYSYDLFKGFQHGVVDGHYTEGGSYSYALILFAKDKNIYINLTGNAPIINTVLICNEETNIEKIRSFLYRAIFCDKPILFLITNMECLELSLKQSIIKTLKDLYQLKKRNINSYLLLMYEKVDSGLSRDIEKLIPEKNLLIINDLLKRNLKPNNLFKEIELYSSKFAGYGKTTEIIHKVNQKRGKYYYLPIGGSFTRNFLVNNLENLNINLENAKNSYLHIDISESDNDDLMNEILFNLLILKFIDSNDKIFYLGYDINIIIEIPRGFTDFEEKYKILKLFNKHYIDKLYPLRLEENAIYIKDSPISIVAEVLYLFERGEIGTKNINLDEPIKRSARECEQILILVYRR